MIIGITGSFGSGKTTITNMFKKYGFIVINADKIYHDNFYKNHPLKNKIIKEFNTLDRKKIKIIVFSDNKKLKKLNKITHPIIIKEIKKQINGIKKNNNKKTIIKNPLFKKSLKNKKQRNKIKIIVDAPLLLEAKVQHLVDKIIVVKCNKKTQIKRIQKKKKYSKKEIENIIKSQMPLKEKIKHADFVVDNNGAMKETGRQVKAIIQTTSL